MTIEQFAAEGRMLLSESDISDAHREFNEWVSDVAVWLDQEFPGTGRSAEWGSLGSSLLIVGGITNSYDTSRWIHFHEVVERRLSWLAQIVEMQQARRVYSEEREAVMTSIFLCHSSKDKFFVRELGEKLRQYSIRVWIDEAEIEIGDSLIKKIGAAITEVDYVGVVLSKNSIESEWVQRELNLAMQREFQEKKVVVLPLLLEKVDLPPFLRDKLYADFTSTEEYSKTFPKLLRALKVPESKIEDLPLPWEEASETGRLTPSASALASFEDIKIVDLDKDRAYKPDPERHLFNLYFKLSSAPPTEWVEIFDAERRFPRHNMWRKAWIEGDYIVVHCIPDEVEKYHFPDLQQDTASSNAKYRNYLKEQADREAQKLAAQQKELNVLDNLRDRLDFNPTSQSPSVQISEDAKELLLTAVHDGDGTIMAIQTAAGLSVGTGGKQFVEERNHRSEARWQRAIEELVDHHFIRDKGHTREILEVTADGYDAADALMIIP